MLALIKDRSGVQLRKTEPPKPGSGEVVIKVMCAGLCRTDVYIAQGFLSAETHRILGHECSGMVCRLGPDTKSSRLGDRVVVFPWLGCGVCEFCRDEPTGYLCPDRQFLGRDIDGCFAEFMAVPERCCVALPEQVSWQAGAYLEPLAAALGVLKTPVRQATRLGVLGDNRIAALTRLVLKEFGKCDPVQVTDETANTFDLIVEAEATESSLQRALSLLKPDGVLVLKSRPAENVLWPIRLQVEKEITTIGVSYGTLQMATLLLRKHHSLFAPLWNEPTPIDGWNEAFEAELRGEEARKSFFLPQEHPCAV